MRALLESAKQQSCDERRDALLVKACRRAWFFLANSNYFEPIHDDNVVLNLEILAAQSVLEWIHYTLGDEEFVQSLLATG